LPCGFQGQLIFRGGAGNIDAPALRFAIGRQSSRGLAPANTESEWSAPGSRKSSFATNALSFQLVLTTQDMN
jgi:hypothetical protein